MKRKIRPPKMIMSEEAREYFRTMGAIGGHQRASNMTPAQRKESALTAVRARWNKAREGKEGKS